MYERTGACPRCHIRANFAELDTGHQATLWGRSLVDSSRRLQSHVQNSCNTFDGRRCLPRTEKHNVRVVGWCGVQRILALWYGILVRDFLLLQEKENYDQVLSVPECRAARYPSCSFHSIWPTIPTGASNCICATCVGGKQVNGDLDFACHQRMEGMILEYTWLIKLLYNS